MGMEGAREGEARRGLSGGGLGGEEEGDREE